MRQIRRYGRDGQPIDGEHTPSAVDVIQVVPASGGQPREIFKGAKLGRTLAWAPDGQFVYYGQMPAGSVWRVATTGGKAEELPIRVEGLARISIHPDGRQLAVSSRTGLQEVLAMGPCAGSLLEWNEEDDAIVVRRAGKYTSADIQRALFGDTPPERRSLGALEEGIRAHIRARHARG